MLFSVRLEASVVELLGQLAEARRVTDAVLIERLTLEEAEREQLLRKDDPRKAATMLLAAIGEHLSNLKAFDEDVTLHVFRAIRDRPALRRLHEKALVPPAKEVTVEQRRRFVHQRIGRFVKEYLGLDSGPEVALPKNSGELIRAYTKLKRRKAK